MNGKKKKIGSYMHHRLRSLFFLFFIVSQCIPKKEIQPLSNLDIENRRF